MRGGNKLELGNPFGGRFAEASDVVWELRMSPGYFGVKYWKARTTSLSSDGKDCKMDRVWGELN